MGGGGGSPTNANIANSMRMMQGFDAMANFQMEQGQQFSNSQGMGNVAGSLQMNAMANQIDSSGLKGSPSMMKRGISPSIAQNFPGSTKMNPRSLHGSPKSSTRKSPKLGKRSPKMKTGSFMDRLGYGGASNDSTNNGYNYLQELANSRAANTQNASEVTGGAMTVQNQMNQMGMMANAANLQGAGMNQMNTNMAAMSNMASMPNMANLNAMNGANMAAMAGMNTMGTVAGGVGDANANAGTMGMNVGMDTMNQMNSGMAANNGNMMMAGTNMANLNVNSMNMGASSNVLGIDQVMNHALMTNNTDLYNYCVEQRNSNPNIAMMTSSAILQAYMEFINSNMQLTSNLREQNQELRTKVSTYEMQVNYLMQELEKRKIMGQQQGRPGN
eukprot:CAMPEP_0115011046 /NCGR_PEP_ID=MMETSP0216-20121206/23736_1 /TAXON_ID=223996 /ORGANISM="Protocruzia adherens, Strain Boccale" /LENGTH=386 /DNA_ID=CAMNT_0002379493 /DNA_START=296 /DNA_END=1456 /DNA_ORIENTATION=-